jgi:hypothetical protein
VEAQCNKCELPSNHFFYCILLLFYFICTSANQFDIFFYIKLLICITEPYYL